MALLQTIKELLGFGSGESERDETETTVTVERELDEQVEAEPEAERDDEAEPGDDEVEPGDDEAEPGDDEAEPGDDEVEPGDTEPDADDGSGEERGVGDDGSDGESVERIKGIGPAYGDRLAEAGIETVDQLAAADPAEVAERASVGEGRAATWIDRAKEF